MGITEFLDNDIYSNFEVNIFILLYIY